MRQCPVFAASRCPFYGKGVAGGETLAEGKRKYAPNKQRMGRKMPSHSLYTICK